MAAPMESTFSKAVQRVLDSWTVLQLAVQHGFGGAAGVAKAEWMGQAVVQWFSENANIETYEVEDFLAHILDAEFNTVADDGSLIEVAKKICGYFHMCSNGRASEVLEEISHLPKADVCRSVAQGTPSEDEDEDNEDDVPPAAIPLQQSEQGQGSSQGTQKSEETPMDTEEDDGWTVVRKSKKK